MHVRIRVRKPIIVYISINRTKPLDQFSTVTRWGIIKSNASYRRFQIVLNMSSVHPCTGGSLRPWAPCQGQMIAEETFDLTRTGLSYKRHSLNNKYKLNIPNRRLCVQRHSILSPNRLSCPSRLIYHDGALCFCCPRKYFHFFQNKVLFLICLWKKVQFKWANNI